MLRQTRDDHLDDGFEISKRLPGRGTPGGAPALNERRTICVPAVIVLLDHDFERVGGHSDTPVAGRSATCTVPCERRETFDSFRKSAIGLRSPALAT